MVWVGAHGGGIGGRERRGKGLGGDTHGARANSSWPHGLWSQKAERNGSAQWPPAHSGKVLLSQVAVKI